MKSSVKLIPMIVLFCIAGVFAEDWPQYLGPSRNSISAQKGILRSWPENGPEVLWTVTLGRGFGGPVVCAGKVYLLDRDDKVGDNLRCFDLSNGKELWNFAYNAPGSVSHPGSRSVPTVDGNNVYSCGPYGDLYCTSINTHKPVWNKNIWKDFGGDRIPMWAITQNPLIYGDLLILASQAPQAGVVAYEKLTGNVKWTTPSLGGVGYVSPAIVKVSGHDHLVMITAPGAGFGFGMPGGFGGGRGGFSGASGGSAAGVTGTKDPGLFSSEHFSMTAFSCKIPNGKYLAKLYFAETYEGITAPGQRVFSFNVQGKEFKDFDIWVKAGGPKRAYVESVPVEVTNGEFRIVFTPKVENPAINAIEILPQAENTASPTTTIRIKAGSPASFTDSNGQVWQPDQGFEGGMTNPMTGGGSGGSFGGAPGGAGGFGGGRGGPGGGKVVGIDPLTGKTLWEYTNWQCMIPVPSAVDAGEGRVLITGGYRAGAAMIKIEKKEDGSYGVTELYKTVEFGAHTQPPILYNGYFYAQYTINERSDGLVCMSIDGQVKWKTGRSPAFNKGGSVLADGLLLSVDGSTTLYLIEPDPSGFKPLASAVLLEQGENWAPIALVDGKLLIRDQSQLKCVKVAQ